MAFLFYFYFVAILIAITFIDLDHTIIPHELTGAGLILGVAAALLIPQGGPFLDLWPGTDWVGCLLGIGIGGGVIFGVIKGYTLIRGIEGMGWGDFTLMAMVGAWVGWRGIVFVLFGAAMQGLLIVLIMVIAQKLRGKRVQDGGFFITDIDAIDLPEDRDNIADPATIKAPDQGSDTEDETKAFGKLAVPFGPFIAVAAVEYLLLGHLVIPWLLAPQ
jgi:prepilin signal peptidase PulO-like enzyme (type II secretory pathway)